MLQISLNDQQLGFDLESGSTHDFLDPYLDFIKFDDKKSFNSEGNLYEHFKYCKIIFYLTLLTGLYSRLILLSETVHSCRLEVISI